MTRLFPYFPKLDVGYRPKMDAVKLGYGPTGFSISKSGFNLVGFFLRDLGARFEASCRLDFLKRWAKAFVKEVGVGPTVNSIGHARFWDPVFYGNIVNTKPGNVVDPGGNDVFTGQRLSSLPVLLDHVCHILGSCSDKKMVRIYARGVIALVTNVKPFVKISKPEGIGNARSSLRPLPGKSYEAISRTGLCSSPFPAPRLSNRNVVVDLFYVHSPSYRKVMDIAIGV